MATYAELRREFSNDGLRSLIEVAVCVKAHAVLREESPSAERLDWAISALRTTVGDADWLLRYLLAANKDSTLLQIQQADEVIIQPKVDEAVDAMYP